MEESDGSRPQVSRHGAHCGAGRRDPRLMRAGATRALLVAALAGAIAVGHALLDPAPAQAVPLPGIPNPFDLGLPSPTDLIGEVFEFFFKTFFGIEAKVTQRTVEWLLAAPVYTDQGADGDLNQLRGDIDAA